MENVYKKNLEMQNDMPILLDHERNLRHINYKLLKEVESEIISKLISLTEIYKLEFENYRRHSSGDNYASDLRPIWEEKWKKAQTFLDEMFKNLGES
ncbi:MAG: 11.7 kDa unknown protein [Plant associated caulimovirus 1]|nr:MAG: 11.7 kDa unknown protein [Plant associated caulimovirus 1]